MRVVGIDTEFIRTRTFFPIAALYQIATDDELAIVDPLARIGSGTNSRRCSKIASIVKVMHACSEDLEVFARHIDVAPKNLFDTQVASGFLGTEFSPSYADLVKRYTGTQLDKHETRSDWLARPLRDEQLRYAVEDVVYLLPIHRAQTRRTATRSVAGAWFDEEIGHRIGFSLVDPELSYLNVRKGVALQPRELGRLQMLCAWRERYARTKDLPRGHVVKDDQLVDLVLQTQRSIATRSSRRSNPRRRAATERELLALIEQADALSDDTRCQRCCRRRSARRKRALLKELKAVGAEVRAIARHGRGIVVASPRSRDVFTQPAFRRKIAREFSRLASRAGRRICSKRSWRVRHAP